MEVMLESLLLGIIGEVILICLPMWIVSRNSVKVAEACSGTCSQKKE